MKINFKRSMSVLAVCTTLFFQGCGGGTTGGTGGDDSGNDSADRKDIGGADGKFKYDRVTIAGSSITWGKGYLGEESYVGEVEKYLREVKADTLNPKELYALTAPYNNIPESFSYQGELNIYRAGSVIESVIPLEASDSITMVYAGSNAVVKMEVDGVECSGSPLTISGSFKPVKLLTPSNPKDGTGEVRSFRETDERSVAKICENLENKAHNFKLTVVSGEFHLNFITNHMYHFQNAGIGGYRASDFLKEKTFVNNNHTTTTDQIVAFKPDLFIFESATNDAQPWGHEVKDSSTSDNSTNIWKIEFPRTCTIENNIVKGLNTSGIVKGDVVVIGNYNGDMKNMAVGIVSKTDGSDIVLESNVISYGNNDMNGTTTNCRVKDITAWTDDVREVVKRVKAGSPNAIVGIATSGVPNYTNTPEYTNARKARRLLGYTEIGKKLATEKGWMFFDFFQATMVVNSGVEGYYIDDVWITKKWSIGDNTHPSEKGYPIFGSAITGKI